MMIAVRFARACNLFLFLRLNKVFCCAVFLLGR